MKACVFPLLRTSSLCQSHIQSCWTWSDNQSSLCRVPQQRACLDYRWDAGERRGRLYGLCSEATFVARGVIYIQGNTSTLVWSHINHHVTPVIISALCSYCMKSCILAQWRDMTREPPLPLREHFSKQLPQLIFLWDEKHWSISVLARGVRHQSLSLGKCRSEIKLLGLNRRIRQNNHPSALLLILCKNVRNLIFRESNLTCWNKSKHTQNITIHASLPYWWTAVDLCNRAGGLQVFHLIQNID